MKSTKNKTEKKGFFKTLLTNVTENVKEGATIVGGKVAEVGEKVAETSAKVYEAGTELVAESSHKIQDFTEKQSLKNEERKLLDFQDALKFSFGELTLAHYLENDSLHKTFLTTKNVSNVVEEYQVNEKRLKAIKKEIKKLEKK